MSAVASLILNNSQLGEEINTHVVACCSIDWVIVDFPFMA